ncbi:MAG: glutamine amidotransferase [Phycisphaerae bacterium]|nr:glutamine amidotransferase [Phycisphaerae bacterium]
MQSKKRVLLVGESRAVLETSIKGFNHMTLGFYLDDAAEELKKSIKNSGYELDYLSNEEASRNFPTSEEAINQYDVIIFSDIGLDTILLHPDTLRKSLIMPNRIKLIHDYVKNGGGFIMVGGYMSFQGYEAKARYHGSLIEDLLPVEMLPHDDRVECPEGCKPEIVNPEHPVLSGISTDWPVFLGYNKVKAKKDADVLAVFNDDDVFVASWDYGKGKSMVFTSDCAPHWAIPDFLKWEYYEKFWKEAIAWVS